MKVHYKRAKYLNEEMIREILTHITEADITDVKILKLETDSYGNEHLYVTAKQNNEPITFQINFNYNE